MSQARGLFDEPPSSCRLCGRDASADGLCAFCIKGGAPKPSADLAEARAARDAAIEQVDEHADANWKAQALETVRRVCRRRASFIVDHIWEAGLERPREARALGPIMLAAERAGWCRKTERFEPSAQPQCHANPRRVRESLIYEGARS